MYKIDSFVGVITVHEDSPDLAYMLEIGEHCKVELNGTVYYKIYFNHDTIGGELVFYPKITSTDSIWINVNKIESLELIETA